MIGVHFYNETTKQAVAVFGSLFNNIVVRRRDGKLLPVPIAYGPRSKWIEAQKQFQREEEMFEKLLPRMSYELVAMTYDQNRKLTDAQSMIRIPDSREFGRQRVKAPVPYNLDFTLYIETKNLNDGWQIIEQILPFFTPAYTVKVRHYPVDRDSDSPLPQNTYDMPITLTAVSWADDWTGDISDRRTVEWTLEFQTKVYMHGPVADINVIYDSRAIIATPPAGGTLDGMNRGSDQEGVETGYVSLAPGDSEYTISDSDSSISPLVTDLYTDSDGTIVKIARDIDTL